MKQVTLSIPDDKYLFILELLQSIPYLKLEQDGDVQIPEFHKKILDERLKNSKDSDFIDWGNVNFE